MEIRITTNKNNSLTVYVPAKFAQRFEEALRAGIIDLIESEMNEEEANEWGSNIIYERRGY